MVEVFSFMAVSSFIGNYPTINVNNMHIIGSNEPSKMSTPVRKRITLSEKMEIVHLHESGMSIFDISNSVGRSRSAILGIITPEKSTTPKSQRRVGRPRVTTKRDDRVIVRNRLVDKFKSAYRISRELDDFTDMLVSSKTVSRRLFDAGLETRIPKVELADNNKDQEESPQCATDDVLWAPESWAEDDSGDESEFTLLEPEDKNTGRHFVSVKFSHQWSKESLKFGAGRVIVWGAVSAMAMAAWYAYLIR